MLVNSQPVKDARGSPYSSHLLRQYKKNEKQRVHEWMGTYTPFILQEKENLGLDL